jgi:hypothetical protein
MYSKRNLPFITFFLTILVGFMHPNGLHAQHEELKQSIDAFVNSKAEKFDKKYLNQSEPDYGELANTNFTFHDFFQLKAKERSVNNLGNNVKMKYNCSFYAYEDGTERDYALSFWFKNFIDGRRITPGREVRTYKGTEPTIIIINESNVCIINFSCYNYDPDSFRDLRKELLAFFGNADSMVIEIQCDGPLKWTKNPPDPKDRKWRM